jgi:isoquinoline 1-oxidoreductase beta subunit
MGSFIATVVELAVDGREVRVRRVVCAVDCGIAVNPSTIEAQIQGAVVDGLATALKAEVTIDQGRIQQSNFLDFEWLRMGDMPVVDVYVIPSFENPTGIGELGYPPIPAAVANAVFAATGKRVRRLPIRF